MSATVSRQTWHKSSFQHQSLDYEHCSHLFVRCYSSTSYKPTCRKSESLFWTTNAIKKVSNKELEEKVINTLHQPTCWDAAQTTASPHLSYLALRLQVYFPWLKVQLRFEWDKVDCSRQKNGGKKQKEKKGFQTLPCSLELLLVQILARTDWLSGFFGCCRRQLAGKACFQFNLKAVVLNEYSRQLFGNRKGKKEMDKQEITGDHAGEGEKQQFTIPERDQSSSVTYSGISQWFHFQPYTVW